MSEPEPQETPNNLLAKVVAFSRALHDAGIPVSSANLIDFCQCFGHIDISQRDDFYAAARTTLVSSCDHLACFDSVFSAFWEAPDQVKLQARSQEQKGDDSGHDRRRATLRLIQGEGLDDHRSEQRRRLELAYSPDELLLKQDIGRLEEQDVERARRLLHELVKTIASHWNRRRTASRKGRELDFRRMLRQGNLLSAEGFLELSYRKRKVKKTKLTLLCDVSGSMQRYSRFLIQLMYGLRGEIADLEVAVFSTRMTVISDLLKTRGLAASLQAVADHVDNWAGGTDIGGCLKQFNDHYARDLLHSRAVVILLSDGWDRGDPQLMQDEMKRLKQRVYKLLWLNPLLGGPGYQPLTRGMQTALPFLDHFLPAHDLHSLAQSARILNRLWH